MKSALLDGRFLSLVEMMHDAALEELEDPLHRVPGKKKELKNIEQVLDIVKRAVDAGQ